MRERNDKDAHARSFDKAADVYEAARPGYPAEAVAWLLEGVSGPVLDLGAGTGKLTRSVLDRGFDAVAVDPSPAMLGVLAEALPEVDTRVGSGERIPLDDASVGAVVAGQAWHWVDPAVAVPEVARVLRPGGTLGLVWNFRDESVDWVRELGQLMQTETAYASDEAPPVVGPPFAEIERHDVRWVQPMTVDGMLDLARSRSYFITKDADTQAAVIASLRRLASEHPDLAGRDVFELPYVTECYRARLGA
ncbi:class I SAM-dependent methyltransferase [Leifsonia poae]|uniref:Methyltransferase n=1 Tax=Leifsonia poae TaxID=110933 RepID=A0A9W6H5X5_9MICO|nr:class I SAM-dependent methyltransferase [Leifsonia poae]GLJ74479.1 putative methyltransferase [Leifsonia poae]